MFGTDLTQPFQLHSGLTKSRIGPNSCTSYFASPLDDTLLPVEQGWVELLRAYGDASLLLAQLLSFQKLTVRNHVRSLSFYAYRIFTRYRPSTSRNV